MLSQYYIFGLYPWMRENLNWYIHDGDYHSHIRGRIKENDIKQILLKIQGTVALLLLLLKWDNQRFTVWPPLPFQEFVSLFELDAFLCSVTQPAFLKKEKRWNTNQFQRKRKPGLKIVFPILRLCVHLLPPEVKGGDVDKVVLASPTCRTCSTCQACSACPACCPPLPLDALLGPHHFTLESDFEWLRNSSVKSLWVTTDLSHRFYRTESELAPKLVTR